MGAPSQLLPIKPLDGAAGYSRWKESILLRLRTLGLAHVVVLLSDAVATSEAGAGAGGVAAAQWERDDALCRGHILHTLSDRVFALHAHRRTARALWTGLRNAYEPLPPKHRSARPLADFEFSPDAPVPEQLADFEAVAAASGYDLSDPYVHIEASSKVAPLYPEYWMLFTKEETMDDLWRIVRLAESYNRRREQQQQDTEEEEEEAAPSIVAKKVRCYNCGGLGHMARNCAR